MSRAASLAATLGLIAVAVGTVGCGSGAAPGTGFRWIGAGRAPATWSPGGRLAAGTLARPPGWSSLRGDRGTVSFELLGADARIVGYLNATPRQGAETLGGWPRFRLSHNADEGDRDVRLLAEATRLRVGAARASCVADTYRTRLSAYHEIACLTTTRGGSAVVVGAAPPDDWARRRAVLERAIAAFVTS